MKRIISFFALLLLYLQYVWSGTYYITYSNPEGWQTVYCYVWDKADGNKTYLGGWPGTILDKQEDESWSYRLVVNKPLSEGMIIFGNGGYGNGNQTADLRLSDYSTYSADESTLCSGTLPVLYISTSDSQDEVNKRKLSNDGSYTIGTYYIDNTGHDGFENIGSKEEPLPLRIKGRGNYTFKGFDKKPYKIKLEKKQKLAGLPKGKTFALMAGADDPFAWLRNTVGYELSRELNMPWTPAQQPIEVIWNQNYLGLYMLTEAIPDVKDGWLLEIDNYKAVADAITGEKDEQLYLNGNEWITIHCPDSLSSEQRTFIQQKITTLTTSVAQAGRDNTWEDEIDLDILARYYIVQEILDDTESFHGSCYFYMEQDPILGGYTKWKFGPVWDFGNAYGRGISNKHIYVDPSFKQHWIGEIAQSKRFHEHIVELWRNYLSKEFENLHPYIDNFCSHITEAAISDGRRWSQYNYSDVDTRKQRFLKYLDARISWLKDQWGDETDGIEYPEQNTPDSPLYYDLSGRRIAHPNSKGLYIIKGRKTFRVMKMN